LRRFIELPSDQGLPTAVIDSQVAICFGLLLPLNIVLARNFKEFTPTWFHLHRVIGTVAWTGGARCVASLPASLLRSLTVATPSSSSVGRTTSHGTLPSVMALKRG
jgi:hypothetical protein